MNDLEKIYKACRDHFLIAYDTHGDNGEIARATFYPKNGDKSITLWDSKDREITSFNSIDGSLSMSFTLYYDRKFLGHVRFLTPVDPFKE